MSNSDNLPHLYRPIATRRCNMLAVGQPRYRVNRIALSAKGLNTALELRSCRVGRGWVFGVPNLHNVVFASGGDAFAIGRPCNHAYPIGMSAIRPHLPTFGDFPDLYYLVLARRSDEFAIG